MTVLRTSASGPALFLNGKPALVSAGLAGGGGGTVTPPAQTLVITSATGVAGGASTLNGIYANGTPLGMAYSTNNGASYTSATSPTIAGGSFSLTTGALAAGSYQVLVRDSVTLVASPAATLTIAAGGTGVAAALTQSTVMDSYAGRQRDVRTGNPPGFSTTWNQGWGAVKVTITPGAGAPTSGGLLFARLYDADSLGATTAPGTGTLLQAAVQVYSSLTAVANQTVTLPTIPAGPFFYYMDLALDAAFTNPVRVGKPFGVGDGTVYLTRSVGASIGSAYAYSDATMPADLSVIVPPPAGGVSLAMDGNGAGANGSATFLHCGSPGSATTTVHSTGTAEYLRLMTKQSGVIHFLFGCPVPGGNMESFAVGNAYYNVLVNNLAHIDSKFRYALWVGNGGSYSAQQWKRQAALMHDALKALSSVPVLFQFDGTGGGWFGRDGSKENYGYTQLAGAAAELEASRSDFISMMWYGWNGFANNHPSMLARVEQARQWFRCFMAIEPVGGLGSGKGPTIVSGTRAAGSSIIRLRVQQDGGSGLVARRYNETSPTVMTEGTPTAAELRNFIAVYPAGGSATRGNYTTLVPMTQVTLDPANNDILVDLGTAPANGLGFTVFLGCDFYTIGGDNPTPGVMITDNRVDTANGIPFGYPIRSTPAGINIVPTTGSAVLNINTPSTTVAGGLLVLTGPSVAGALPVNGVLVSLNGAAAVVPMALKLRGDNSWEGFIKAPTAIASNHTVAVFRPGQGSPDATSSTFATATRATLMGVPGSANAAYASMSAGAVSSLEASYSGFNYGTLAQDAAGTQPLTSTMQFVRSWADELGTASNAVVQSNASTLAPPLWDFRCGYDLKPGLVGEAGTNRPGGLTSLVTASTTPAVAAACTGDFSALTVYHIIYDGRSIWSLGSISLLQFYNLVQFGRGANSVQLNTGNPGQQYGKCLVRYRQSDGLAEVFFNNAGTTISATFATAAVTPGALTIAPKWGNLYDLKFWSSRLSDADRDAALAYATATWG